MGSSIEGCSVPPCTIRHPQSASRPSLSLLTPTAWPGAHTAIGRHGGSQTFHDRHSQQQNNPIIDSIRSTRDRCSRYLKTNDMFPKDNVLPTFISGTFAFYATAFSSQLLQQKVLKMSTGTRPIILPISVGAMTVALGSWMGHLAGLGTTAAWGSVQDTWKQNKLLESMPKIGGIAMRSVEEMTRPMRVFADGLGRAEKRERKEAWMHAARICIIGLLSYKLIFRSNYSSISPSSYTARGSFARIGIPAPPNFNYANKAQRSKIERIGRAWGCHTCGSRMIFSNLKKKVPKFHGDHIPPVSVAKQLNNRWYRRPLGWKVSQKFYPQCRDCSNKQGGLLGMAVSSGHKNLHAVGGGQESYFHGRRLRIGHMAGGAVAVLSVGNEQSPENGKEGKLVEASRTIIKSYQDWIEDLGMDLKRRVENLWRNFP